EDGIRDGHVTGVQTCALPICVAGFLEAPDLGVFKGSTRKYVRTLWDRWWPHRDAMQRMVLLSKVWRLSGTRPLNHPQRRLAALRSEERRVGKEARSARWSAGG